MPASGSLAPGVALTGQALSGGTTSPVTSPCRLLSPSLLSPVPSANLSKRFPRKQSKDAFRRGSCLLSTKQPCLRDLNAPPPSAPPQDPLPGIGVGQLDLIFSGPWRPSALQASPGASHRPHATECRGGAVGAGPPSSPCLLGRGENAPWSSPHPSACCTA